MSKQSLTSGHLGRPANPDARALRRDQILAGARACFLRKGFHAATTAEISAEAGVSVANLYQYFPAKDDLVRALIDEDLAVDLALIDIIEDAGSLRQGLEQTTRLIAASDTLATSSLRLEILAEASRNPAIAEVVRRADDRMVAAMATLITRRQAAGEVRRDVDPDLTARLILSLFDGLIGRLAFNASDGEGLGHGADAMILAAVLAPSQS